MSSLTEKTGSEWYDERARRIDDAINLRETDRVPFNFRSAFWHAKLAGITFEEAVYDVNKNIQAAQQAIRLLQPDSILVDATATGQGLEGIDYKPLKWPGHGGAPNVGFQYIDEQFMSADEYDEYLLDPTGYYQSKFLGRIAGAFKVFEHLPQFATVNEWFQVVRQVRAFANPELQQGLQHLFKVGEQLDEMYQQVEKFHLSMAEEGYPAFIGGQCKAPYDWFVDTMRGSRGGTLDMLRNKDRLLESMSKAHELQLKNIVADTKAASNRRVILPLHWGLDGFMSPTQFKSFYWPELKAVITYLIENDLTPCVLWEGKCDSRLELIGDIPKGKAVYMFESTDLVKAKEVLGDTVCLQGNVPASLLIGGTPDDVDDYCRNLIQKVGKGGGFILDGAVGIADESKTENVIAMAESVKKYAN